MSQVVDLEAMSREMANDIRLGFPTVRRVMLEQGFDSTGDAALFIWLLLDDDVKDKDLAWSAIQPLVDEAERIARARQNDAWPYARVRRVSEWSQRNLSPEEEAAEEASQA